MPAIQTNERLDELVKSSRGLSDAKKEAILSISDNLPEEKAVSIIEVLEDEEKRLKSIDRKYEKREADLGGRYIFEIKNAKSAAAREDLRACEREDKAEESAAMGNLEKELDEMPGPQDNN